jgi:hypothetical protein
MGNGRAFKSTALPVLRGKTWFSWRRVETAAGSVYNYFELKQAAAAASQSLLLFDANEAILLGCVRF